MRLFERVGLAVAQDDWHNAASLRVAGSGAEGSEKMKSEERARERERRRTVDER